MSRREGPFTAPRESGARVRRGQFVVGMALFALVLVNGAEGAEREADPHAVHDLGKVEFVVPCSEDARAEFVRGVSLLHHMTYPQARASFERVARLDPECAMAHWGLAMTLFQPLWPTRPGPADLRRGWEAVEKARALKPTSERERLFVEAAGAFFRDPETRDYWERIRAWEKAMQTLYVAFPDDPEAGAFYALAHLASAPSAGISLAHSERAAAILLDIYERNPEHPGAMHYLVHANDAPGREKESLEIVRKYESVAPHNPHALHMPTHIYTRLGHWDAVVRGNLRAAEAALEHPAGERGELVWDEFPHAIEYLVYAHLQTGDDEAAAAQLKRLRSTPRLEPSFKTAFHLASTQARYALERRAWSEAFAVVPREPAILDWDRFPWAEGVSWFARGLGAARLGEIAEARIAAKRLHALDTIAKDAGEDLFARNLRVLALSVDAWIAHADEDAAGSLASMRAAADLEASTPKHAVTPGPTLPAHELLGDLLTEQGDAKGALAAYERSLELYPGRFNSLLGAARAARASGNAAAARHHYERLLELAGRGTRDAALEEARRFAPAGD